MTELTKISANTAPITTNAPDTLLSLISNAASNPNVDIDKMERLLTMHQTMTAQQAEAEFNNAMAKVQSKMGRISTDASNSQTRSRYATYAKLDRALRPIYTEAGFSLSFGTDPSPNESILIVTCQVSHTTGDNGLSGHTRKYSIPIPADGKGAKDNAVMTKTHATGSAVQYGMRYLLRLIFNIATTDDEDDDGNGASASLTVADHQWIVKAAAITTMEEYEAERKNLTAAYGNQTANIPAIIKQSFNSTRQRLEPGKNDHS